MQISAPSRAGLLTLVTVLHIALLWWVAGGAARPELTPPTPLPAVMVEMITPTPPVARPEPPRPQPPAPPKVVKPQPAPKPVVRPAPVHKPAPAPVPIPAAQPAPAAPAPAPASSQAAPVAPAAPAPVAAPAPAPAPLTPPKYNAAYLSNPVPAYPAMLRRAGEEGRVVLRVFVTAEGKAGDVQVLKPASSPLFDEAALAAVRKWRFVPAKRGDVAVAEWVQVPIEFKLN